MPSIRYPTSDVRRHRRKSSVVVPHRARWYQRLVAALIYSGLRCLAGTVRFKMDDRTGLFKGTTRERLIFAFWHNRLALSAVLYHYTWEFRAKSWDRFQIPLPFTRCEVTIGRVLRVPREASDAKREALRRQLEADLRAITRD
jgi:lysophospholipid acyltransferase (LPLAT)-like uncharacterized protein